MTEITSKLMDKAKHTLYVANPFVEGATLGKCLRNAAKRGVKVLLISRRPVDDPKKWEFHKTLTAEKVLMYYSGGYGGAGGIHSKLVIIDEEVAIISSMNFTANSEALTWKLALSQWIKMW
ncbi:MAG: hypothetical protein BAJATHORv1_90003 [Candidatus Thorarchaeota archaeon]|nr:MAG: hypothetical protein BAJATHORv1_90003 [Candidatus Thorarchaeota archaeon]